MNDKLTIDVPRLRKELEYITAHPEEWRQGEWLWRVPVDEEVPTWRVVDKLDEMQCNTFGCLAGNTVLHAGDKIKWQGQTSTMVVNEDDFLKPISQRARELLGLTKDQANDLFAGTNSLAAMWRMANSFTNGEIEVPHPLPVWSRTMGGLEQWNQYVREYERHQLRDYCHLRDERCWQCIHVEDSREAYAREVAEAEGAP